MKRPLIYLLLALMGLSACDEYVPTPRPWAYPRIEVPAPAQRRYATLQSEACPVRLQYPAQGELTRNRKDSCWVDIHFPAYDLTWHLTVREIEPGPLGVSPYFEDHRKLVYKHSKKASRIEEQPFETEQGDGFWFEVYGEVGTPAQVFLTDPQDRYSLVLSFYYQTATARDSLRPITQYMKEEMRHAVETLAWQP